MGRPNTKTIYIGQTADGIEVEFKYNATKEVWQAFKEGAGQPSKSDEILSVLKDLMNVKKFTGTRLEEPVPA